MAFFAAAAGVAVPILIDAILNGTADKAKRKEIQEYSKKQENMNKDADTILNELRKRDLVNNETLNHITNTMNSAVYSTTAKKNFINKQKLQTDTLKNNQQLIDAVTTEKDNDNLKYENLKNDTLNKNLMDIIL